MMEVGLEISEKPQIKYDAVPLGSEKLTLGFLADVLYIKGVICIEEWDAIMDVSDATGLEEVIERMFRGDFNVYKRGEMRSSWSFDDKKVKGV